jgi:tetratricopeptide (TPR) repeat protein
MQRFQYPYLLSLFLLILPVIGLMIWNYKWKEKTIAKFFKSPIADKIIPFVSKFNMKLRFGIFMAAIILLIIAIANPQIGTKQEKIKGQGIDIMILLDVSNSMLAQDIQPNRLERAKLFINKLLDNLKNDRVGFVIFAGNAYLQVPLTIDFASIKMSLPIINPTDIPSQGTNIGEAVDLAGKSLGLTDSKNKAIVIVTDGEDHDANANAAIEKAKKNGIKVFAIGVGEEKGAPIPMGEDVKKDENGQPILTAFNRKMLEELATIGNGNFYHLGQQSDIVEDVASSLGKIEGKEFEEFDFSNYNSYFYWFALAALLLLMIEFIIPDIDVKKFIKNISILVFIILGLNSPIIAQQSKTNQETKDKSKTLIRQGNSNFQNNKFQDAEYNYRKALIANPNSKTAMFNLGNALYQQQKFQEAADQYEASIAKNDDKVSKAKGYHNLGNSNFKGNQLDKAISAYENALKINPNDMDTKYNLALAKKQQDKKGGGKNQQQQQQDKKEEQDKKDKKDGKPQEGEGDKEQEKEQEQPQNNGKNMNKEDVQRLLEALKNQEQNTQNKVQQQKGKPEQKPQDKDW